MNEKPKQLFIAEIKTQSPYGFKSEYPFISLMEQAIQYGDWISVHTSPLWGGSFEALEFVRRLTKKPILAKGIHLRNDDVWKAMDYGADYVLIVDRMFGPSGQNGLLPEYLIRENHNLNELKEILDRNPSLKNQKFMVNQRDLRNGLPKKAWEMDRYKDLGIKWLCQASGIKQISDIDPAATAFIVGQNLVDFCKEWKVFCL